MRFAVQEVCLSAFSVVVALAFATRVPAHVLLLLFVADL